MTLMGRQAKFLTDLSLYGLIIVTMVKAQQQQSISEEQAQPENHIEVFDLAVDTQSPDRIDSLTPSFPFMMLRDTAQVCCQVL